MEQPQSAPADGTHATQRLTCGVPTCSLGPRWVRWAPQLREVATSYGGGLVTHEAGGACADAEHRALLDAGYTGRKARVSMRNRVIRGSMSGVRRRAVTTVRGQRASIRLRGRVR